MRLRSVRLNFFFLLFVQFPWNSILHVNLCYISFKIYLIYIFLFIHLHHNNLDIKRHHAVERWRMMILVRKGKSYFTFISIAYKLRHIFLFFFLTCCAIIIIHHLLDSYDIKLIHFIWFWWKFKKCYYDFFAMFQARVERSFFSTCN